MRLIDADALHLGKFVEPRTEWHQGWNDALDAATTQAPTIDAVPVVRCKDCARCVIHKGIPICNKWRTFPEVSLEDFCSYGERKGQENPCDHCMSGSYRGCDGCGYAERKDGD